MTMDYAAERAKKIITRVSINQDRSEKQSAFHKEDNRQLTASVTTSPSAPIDPNPELLNYQFNGRPPHQLGTCVSTRFLNDLKIQI